MTVMPHRLQTTCSDVTLRRIRLAIINPNSPICLDPSPTSLHATTLQPQELKFDWKFWQHNGTSEGFDKRYDESKLTSQMYTNLKRSYKIEFFFWMTS